MNKADLIDLLSKRHVNLSHRDIKDSVDLILNKLSQSVANGQGAEIRGFGSFSRKSRAAYVGKHPKKMFSIAISKKYIPFFKAGKFFKSMVKDISK